MNRMNMLPSSFYFILYCFDINGDRCVCMGDIGLDEFIYRPSCACPDIWTI